METLAERNEWHCARFCALLGGALREVRECPDRLHLVSVAMRAAELLRDAEVEHCEIMSHEMRLRSRSLLAGVSSAVTTELYRLYLRELGTVR